LGFLFYEFLRRSAKPPWELPPFPFQNTSFIQSVRLLVPSRRSLLPSLLLLLLLVVLEASMCHCTDLDYWYNWTRRYKSIAKQKSPQFSLCLLSLFRSFQS
jgi:hypothetical protein